MHIVIINGFPQSGKTTFEQLVNDWLKASKPANNHNCYTISSVDYVKKVAQQEKWWDGKKTPASRKFLSDLKDVLTNYANIPFWKVVDQVEEIEEQEKDSKSILFIDCREPDCIDEFKNYFDEAITVLVRRKITEEDNYSNHADAQVLEYAYDYIIENNGTFCDLMESAITFIDDINKKENPDE